MGTSVSSIITPSNPSASNFSRSSTNSDDFELIYPTIITDASIRSGSSSKTPSGSGNNLPKSPLSNRHSSYHLSSTTITKTPQTPSIQPPQYGPTRPRLSRASTLEFFPPFQKSEVIQAEMEVATEEALTPAQRSLKRLNPLQASSSEDTSINASTFTASPIGVNPRVPLSEKHCSTPTSETATSTASIARSEIMNRNRSDSRLWLIGK